MTLSVFRLPQPESNRFGDQPTLELVRQVIEDKVMYFLEKEKRGDKKMIEGIRWICAMRHPGGGYNDIPSRLKRHFFVTNLPPPSSRIIDGIYGSLLRVRFHSQPDLAAKVIEVTGYAVDLWTKIKVRLLPTPSKCHYFFTMHDLARVFQGTNKSNVVVVVVVVETEDDEDEDDDDNFRATLVSNQFD